METTDNKTSSGRPYFKGITKQEKSAWLAALRSNDYRQCTGTGYHEETDSYCCLGVLAKVIGEDPARNWHLILSESGQTNVLYTLNDDDGLKFPEIADFIEANVNTID